MLAVPPASSPGEKTRAAFYRGVRALFHRFCRHQHTDAEALKRLLLRQLCQCFPGCEGEAGQEPLPPGDAEELQAFFRRWRFSPDEQSVGEDLITPGMLGYIHERLTGGNKAKGAYYTPPGIVRFICCEALICHLEDAIGGESARRLVEQGDASDLTSGERAAARHLLQGLKACDPAMGAGAFLLGLLDVLTTCRVALEDAPPTSIRRDILQNSLYGADTDPGAVEVTRWRLRLAAGEEPPAGHLMQGDSLRQHLHPGVREQGGFDIIVGNPPYISLSAGSPPLHTLYEGAGFESFVKSADIYCLFYERGWQLLKAGGILGYLCSDSWLRADYGERLRAFLSQKANPLLLVELAGHRLFAHATVDTCILLFSKSANAHRTRCVPVHSLHREEMPGLSQAVAACSELRCISSPEAWRLLSPLQQRLKERMERMGSPLHGPEWRLNEGDGNRRGIVTGCNEAFLVDADTRAQILRACATPGERERTDALIRPLLRGRNIARYRYEVGTWLLALLPSAHCNIDDYPAVRTHLLRFGRERLEQSGRRHLINGRQVRSRKKTAFKWYETQDFTEYREAFYREERIVYGQFQGAAAFALAPAGVFLSSNEYMISLPDYSPKCLLAFLNSRPMEWLLGMLTGKLGRHARIAQKSSFMNLSVPRLPEEEQARYAQLVDAIHGNIAAGRPIEELLQRIDTMICDYYQMTPEEKKLVLGG